MCSQRKSWFTASRISFGAHLTKCKARVVVDDLCSPKLFIRDRPFAAFEPVSTTKTERKDPGNCRDYTDTADHDGCVIESFLHDVSIHIVLQEW